MYFCIFVGPFFFYTFFAEFDDNFILTNLKGGEFMDYETRKRLATQREKIIQLLIDAGEDGVTNTEMATVSLRYGGHINEMYRQGYKIKKLGLGGGVFRYWLLSIPSQIKIPENAHDIFMDEVERRLGADISAEISEIHEDLYFHTVRRNGWYLREMEEDQQNLH